MKPHLGQSVRYTGKTLRFLDGGKVTATLCPGVTGTVTGYHDSSPYPCPPQDCTQDDHCACDGTGTIPADPTWVVAWQCPEGSTLERLIRADGRGWEPAQ